MNRTKAKMINDAVISTVDRKAEERGCEQGIEQEKHKVASNMLKENIPIDLIAKITGLSIEQVKKLQRE